MTVNMACLLYPTSTALELSFFYNRSSASGSPCQIIAKKKKATTTRQWSRLQHVACNSNFQHQFCRKKSGNKSDQLRNVEYTLYSRRSKAFPSTKRPQGMPM